MPPEALTAANGTTFLTSELLTHWTLFGMWADGHGISLIHPDDWLPWWELYIYAAFQENQRL